MISTVTSEVALNYAKRTIQIEMLESKVIKVLNSRNSIFNVLLIYEFIKKIIKSNVYYNFNAKIWILLLEILIA